jgi:hypothetical protein
MASAVRTASIFQLQFYRLLAICLAHNSMYFKSAAMPFPLDHILVGVFTDIKMI